jgi:TorA maturation chaperone TorD
MNETLFASDPAVETALCRSVLYDTLALALRRPGEVSLERLSSFETREPLRDAADEVERAAGYLPLQNALEALLGCAARADVDDLRREHGRLFGHTTRGKLSPYETEYGGDGLFRQADELADIGGFYHAFGLAMEALRRERADHIAAECEFLSFLGFKEAYEVLGGNGDSSREVREAEKLFLREHLGRFARAFCLALSRESMHPFYAAVGEFGRQFIDGECRHFGFDPGPELLKLRSAREDDVPMACGRCPLSPTDSADAELLGEEDRIES